MRSFHYVYGYPGDLGENNDGETERPNLKQYEYERLREDEQRGNPGGRDRINEGVSAIDTFNTGMRVNSSGGSSMPPSYGQRPDLLLKGRARAPSNNSALQVPVYTDLLRANMDGTQGINGRNYPYIATNLMGFGSEPRPGGDDTGDAVHQKAGSNSITPDVIHNSNKAWKYGNINSASPTPHFHVPSTITDEDEFILPEHNTRNQGFGSPISHIGIPADGMPNSEQLANKVFELPYKIEAQQLASLQEAAQAAFGNEQLAPNNQVRFDHAANNDMHQEFREKQEQEQEPDLEYITQSHKLPPRNAPTQARVGSAAGSDRKPEPPQCVTPRRLYDGNAFGNAYSQNVNFNPNKRADWHLRNIDIRPVSPRRFSVPTSCIESPRHSNFTPDVRLYDRNMRDNQDVSYISSSLQALRMDQHLDTLYTPQQGASQMHMPNLFTRKVSMALDMKDTPPEVYAPKQPAVSFHEYNDRSAMRPKHLTSHITMPAYDESARRHSIEGSMPVSFAETDVGSPYRHVDHPRFKNTFHVASSGDDELTWRRKSAINYSSSKKQNANTHWILPEDKGLVRDVLFYTPLYVVEFKNKRIDFFFTSPSNESPISAGDLVVVEADRGKDLGKVIAADIRTTKELYKYKDRYLESSSNAIYDPDTGCVTRQSKYIYPKCIYRLASASEVDQLSSKKRDEDSSVHVCKMKVKKKNLPMSIVDAEYQWFDMRRLFYLDRGLVR